MVFDKGEHLEHKTSNSMFTPENGLLGQMLHKLISFHKRSDSTDSKRALFFSQRLHK